MFFLFFFSTTSFASNLIVMVKDIETKNPIKGALVSVLVFNEKEESWQQGWWWTSTKENGIVLRLGLEMWDKCVVKVEAKGYFSTFYGTAFYFYGVPKIITISSSNTRLELYLQPIKEPPKLEEVRTVKK
jgi:hypothetical protein